MKTVFHHLLVLLIVGFVFSCQSSHEKASAIPVEGSPSPMLPISSWRTLITLEQRIKVQPDNRQLIQKFLFHSVDSSKGLIYTVGYGLLPASNVTSGLQLQFGEQAALMEAERWAAYVHQWIQEKTPLKPFGNLSARHPLPIFSKETKIVKDTIFVFAAFRISKPVMGK